MLDSEKCDNKTWSSCLSFTTSFCSKCWNCLYPCPNKKGSWQRSLSVVYLHDCEICARTSCLIWFGIFFYRCSQFVLSYRFGWWWEIKQRDSSWNEDEQIHKLKFVPDTVRQSKQILQEHCNSCFGSGNFTICSLSNFSSSAAGRKYGIPHFHGVLSVRLLSELCFGQKD